MGATDAGDLRPVPDRVGVAVARGRASWAPTLGYGVTLLAGQAFESGLSVSPAGLVLAAGFAIGIGLGAGVYPALRASRLAPVEAIRG